LASTIASSVCSRSFGVTAGGVAAGGVAHAHDVDAGVGEEGDEVVDGGVRSGGGEHGLVPVDGLADDLDGGRRLPGARRTVDEVDVLGAQGPADGGSLAVVELLVVPVLDAGGLGLGGLEPGQRVAQLGEATVGRGELVEGRLHPLEGDVVDVQVQPQALAEHEPGRLGVEDDVDRPVRRLGDRARRVVVP
jgi:hypothetical protein